MVFSEGILFTLVTFGPIDFKLASHHPINFLTLTVKMRFFIEHIYVA